MEETNYIYVYVQNRSDEGEKLHLITFMWCYIQKNLNFGLDISNNNNKTLFGSLTNINISVVLNDFIFSRISFSLQITAGRCWMFPSLVMIEHQKLLSFQSVNRSLKKAGSCRWHLRRSPAAFTGSWIRLKWETQTFTELSFLFLHPVWFMPTPANTFHHSEEETEWRRR